MCTALPPTCVSHIQSFLVGIIQEYQAYRGLETRCDINYSCAYTLHQLQQLEFTDDESEPLRGLSRKTRHGHEFMAWLAIIFLTCSRLQVSDCDNLKRVQLSTPYLYKGRHTGALRAAYRLTTCCASLQICDANLHNVHLASR